MTKADEPAAALDAPRADVASDVDAPEGVLLSLAYDGRSFSGFAPQRDRRTIAGELLGALREIDPRVGEVRGASRTDAGVHAYDQRVAFDPSRALPLTAWLHGLSRGLPREVAARRIWTVPRGYAPRFEARSKTYRYLLLVEASRDPFLEGRAWRVPELGAPDVASLLRDEASALVGTHDFHAFRAMADQRQNTVRTLSRVEVSCDPERPSLLRVDVTGSGFLYNMVRIIVGALVDVGRGRLRRGAFERALASKDRRHLGITAPPDGLYLRETVLEGDEDRAPSPALKR